MKTEKKEILDTLREIAKSHGEYMLLINGSVAHLYPIIDNTLILSIVQDLEFTIDKIEDAYYNDNNYATIKVEDKCYDIDIVKSCATIKVGYKYCDIDVVKKVEMKKIY